MSGSFHAASLVTANVPLNDKLARLAPDSAGAAREWDSGHHPGGE